MNLFIQRSSLNIIDVLCHKWFGCYAIYDKDLLRRDESGGFWANNGWNLVVSSSFETKIRKMIFYRASSNAVI